MHALSTRIRQARMHCGITQSELARRVGVRRSAVTQWEHPQGTHPSTHHLIAIATQTATSFEWLSTGRGTAGFDAGEGVALVADEFAQDLDEAELLRLFRRLPTARRRIGLALLDTLGH